ncbi:MAG: SemiSWEET family sugar transporter [Desulfovibrionales bacterium]
MTSPWIELIGYLAGAMTTVSFLPQAIKAFTTRQTRDISLGMYAILTAGVFAWIVYGLAIRSWPVIIANCITLILVVSILILKLSGPGTGRKYKREAV